MKKTFYLLFALCCAISVQAASTMLKNDTFKNKTGGWSAKKYWGGELTFVTGQGAKGMRLSSTEHNGKTYGRIIANARKYSYLRHTMLKVTVTAQGEGRLTAGLMLYAPGKKPVILRSEPFELTNKAKKYTANFTLLHYCDDARPLLETDGSGTAFITAYRMEAVTDKGAEIPPPPMQIVRSGSPVKEVCFVTTLPEREVAITRKSGGKVTEKLSKTGKTGKVCATPENVKSGIIEISVSAAGASATNYISVENAADFDRNDAIAKKIKLPGKLNILFLGDSLSDFYRGQNYIDRFGFWLNRYNPGMANIRNAGVAGDYITRVESRLNGTLPGGKAASRQYMYSNLFDRQYDMIFIFLGQNDTRCLKSDKYARPLVSPADQEQSYRNVLKFLKEKSPKAQIVLISPSPSDEAGNMKKNKAVLFGKSEHVNNFDKVNRKLCAEYGMDYVDILTPMRKSADVSNFYVKDGVHLSADGGRMLSNLLLTYMAGRK